MEGLCQVCRAQRTAAAAAGGGEQGVFITTLRQTACLPAPQVKGRASGPSELSGAAECAESRCHTHILSLALHAPPPLPSSLPDDYHHLCARI